MGSLRSSSENRKAQFPFLIAFLEKNWLLSIQQSAVGAAILLHA